MNEINKDCAILVVDDNVIISDTVITLLGCMGFQNVLKADSVTTGKAAILAAEKPFPLIITDLELGDGNGLEILAYVRQIDRNKKVKVIVMTGTIDDRLLSRVYEAEPDGLILKPFDMETLKNTLVELGFLPAPDAVPA